MVGCLCCLYVGRRYDTEWEVSYESKVLLHIYIGMEYMQNIQSIHPYCQDVSGSNRNPDAFLPFQLIYNDNK